MIKPYAYYNEIDPFAAQWIRELIKKRVITDGEVDERSIEDVLPNDVMGFARAHFFAGIAVWDYALNQSGYNRWDQRTWTGSCPCQPFSAAGKRGGVTDERHLWPAFYHLISQCRPVTVFGEQVASKDGLAWLDIVQSDLEAAGYAVGAADIPACGLGAPHIRNRLWFVADTTSIRHNGHSDNRREINRKENEGRVCESKGNSSSHFLAQPPINGRDKRWAEREGQLGVSAPVNGGESGELADMQHQGLQGRVSGRAGTGWENITGRAGCGGPTNGFWADAEWLPCRDGKHRPTGRGIHPLVGKLADPRTRNTQSGSAPTQGSGERYAQERETAGTKALGGRGYLSGIARNGSEPCGVISPRGISLRPAQSSTFPLAYGTPANMVRVCDQGEEVDADNSPEARVMRLKGYGNAIVAPVATMFVKAYMETEA